MSTLTIIKNNVHDDFFILLVLSNQQSKPQIYSIKKNVQQKKAANHHI